MDEFVELLDTNTGARYFAEVACLYFGRHLVAADSDLDYPADKVAELKASIVGVLEALEADWGIGPDRLTPLINAPK